MTDGTDWVDDGTLSRDETMGRLTALDPAPTESDDLHRAVARMAAKLMLFSDATTRGEIVDNAALFAAEVIELIGSEIRADERGRVHAEIQAGDIPHGVAEEMLHDDREKSARAIEEEIPGGSLHESSSWSRGYQDGYAEGLTKAARIVRRGNDG